MKKFLSLALSLVMTLSLVTISAGATEYADLTDKDEIHYEEAVAVLNRIGVITGYEDGSFKPEAELSRGAAAKIIVSLLIGPEAAENLGNTNSPYPDVPAGNNFAGVISFCKTSGIINGYGDGTFRPTANLTGYAFAKMLLGALGYSVDIEGMSGDGWNMVVANLGQAAGLFDRLKFNGNDPVNREMACQMALNTLKATMVEYTGGFTVSAGDAQVVGAQNRNLKTSNQDYAKNIKNRFDDRVNDDWYTVEFAEEHFVDLRLTHNKWNPIDDNFGNPSAQWDYRKVTIGTFPLEADFSFTTKVADKDKSTDASKLRALGLSGYKVESSGTVGVDDYTKVYVNGYEVGDGSTKVLNKVADIADYTDNGTLVKVYVNNNEADFIDTIVVIKSQLMEIKKVGSDFVSLDKYDGGDGANEQKPGFNQDGGDELSGVMDVKISNVEVNDDYYSFLSEKKAGDLVVVIPVSEDHTSRNYEVGGAYVPETVNGTLTRVTTYANVNSDKVGAIDVTLGGTKYPIALWNAGDLNTITADIIDVTKKDVTLYLDSYGNALLADEVGSQDGYMVIKGYYQSLVNGKLVTMVEGWDVGGDLMTLNLGYNPSRSTMVPGDLVKYDNSGTLPAGADWGIYDGNDAYIYDVNTADTSYEIKASNLRVRLVNSGETSNITDGSVKFIYVTFADDGDVDSIEIKTGVQNVDREELLKINDKYSANSNPAEAYTKEDGTVKAVVIKRESNEAISNNLLYVRDVLGTEGVDANGDKIYGYTVARMSTDGLTESETIYSTKKLNRGDFASYALSSHSEFDPFYTLKKHDVRYKTTSVNAALVAEIMPLNKNLFRLGGYTTAGGTADTDIASNYRVLGDSVPGNESNIINVRGAKWLDLATKDGHITSVDEVIDYMTNEQGKNDAGEYLYYNNRTVEIQFVYNDNRDSDGFRTVNLVIVTNTSDTKAITKPVVGVDMSTVVPGAGAEKMSLVDKNTGLDVKSGVVVQAGPTDTVVNGKTVKKYTVTAPFTMTSAEAKKVLRATVTPDAGTNTTLSDLTVGGSPVAEAATTQLMGSATNGNTFEIKYTLTAANGDYAEYTLNVTIDDTTPANVILPTESAGKVSDDSSDPTNGFTANITPAEDKITAKFEAKGDMVGTDGNSDKKLTITGTAVSRAVGDVVTKVVTLTVNEDGSVTTGVAGVTASLTPGTDAIEVGDVIGQEDKEVFETYTAATLPKGFAVTDGGVTYYKPATGTSIDDADLGTEDKGVALTEEELAAGPVDGTTYYTKDDEDSFSTYEAVDESTYVNVFDSTKTYFKGTGNTIATLTDESLGTELTAEQLADGPQDGVTYYTKTTKTSKVDITATEDDVAEATAAVWTITLSNAFLNTINEGNFTITSIKLTDADSEV